jgi:hypothetical protein
MKLRYAEKYVRAKSYHILVSATIAFLVVVNVICVVVYGLRFQNFIVFAVSVILYYLERRNIPDTLVFVMSYPLSWVYLLPIKNEEIEDFFNIPIPPEINVKIDENAINVLPIKTVLATGSVQEKKLITKDIFAQVTKGINIEQNMKYLRQLIRDPHMDVQLYAEQTLEDIESYFENLITKIKNENTIYSCVVIYNYLRTDIPRGIVKSDFANLLREKIKKVSSRVPAYFEIMYYLTGDINYLLESFKKTGNIQHLRLYVFEKLKLRDYNEVKILIQTYSKSLLCNDTTLEDLAVQKVNGRHEPNVK